MVHSSILFFKNILHQFLLLVFDLWCCLLFCALCFFSFRFDFSLICIHLNVYMEFTHKEISFYAFSLC